MPNYNGVWSLTTQYQYAADWSADNVSPATRTANGIAIISNASGLQTFSIATAGNSTDFGDFTTQRNKGAGFGSTTRGVVGGGDGGPVNIIDFITFVTTGDATDFGDLTVAREECAGHSSSTRGLIAGGDTGSKSDVVDYVTIASAGNATDFGDLAAVNTSPLGAGSSVRMVVGGGIEGGAGVDRI